MAKATKKVRKNGKSSDVAKVRHIGIDNQPVSGVKWVDRTTLWSNDYNPNHVATPEMELLRNSLREDGWALPLVVRKDGEIVDGFHRWTLSDEKEFMAMTDGKVPIVILNPASDKAHQIESTVRYNRARGKHVMDLMADIVVKLLALGKKKEQICVLLGMEDEEFERLKDRGNMPKRGGKETFDKGWVPDDGSFLAGEEWEEK